MIEGTAPGDEYRKDPQRVPGRPTSKPDGMDQTGRLICVLIPTPSGVQFRILGQPIQGVHGLKRIDRASIAG